METDMDQSKLVLQLQRENGELRHQLMHYQQKLLTTQAQSLACNSTSSPTPTPVLSPQCASTSRKTKRSILLSGTCFTTPDIKKKPVGDENAQLVKELRKKVKELEVELEKQRKEHLMQLKQKDEFVRKLIARKVVNEKCTGEERKVSTRGSLRKVVEGVRELKSPIRSHRFVSPVQQQTNKKRSFWDITNGNSPSVLAVNGRKTRSHVTVETPSAPSMLPQVQTSEKLKIRYK